MFYQIIKIKEILLAYKFILFKEKIQLEAALQVRAGAFHAADSINVQELQQKLIGLQEELTEMHRYFIA